MKVSHYLGLAAFSFTTILSTGAQALPSGGTVTSGNATIGTSGKTMTINQSSARADINWGRFGSAADEAIHFVQPNKAAITINRVTGNVPSHLAGVLKANGKIVIINSAGITFAAGSQTNTNALIASTARAVTLDSKRISLSDFGDGTIRNDGTINSNSGHVSLVGKNSVINTGNIYAQKGRINLLQGKNAKVAFEDGLAEVGSNGASVGDAIITNTGTLKARGGEITLTNKQMAGVINLDGVVDVRSVRADTGSATGSVAVASLGNINTSASINASGDLDNAGKVVFNSGADLAFKANVDARDASDQVETLDKGGVILMGNNVGFDGDIKTVGLFRINTKNAINIKNGDGAFQKDAIYEDDLERIGSTAFIGQIYAKKVVLENLSDNELNIGRANMDIGNNRYSEWGTVHSSSSTSFADKKDAIKSRTSIHFYSKNGDLNIGKAEAKTVGLATDGGNVTADTLKGLVAYVNASYYSSTPGNADIKSIEGEYSAGISASGNIKAGTVKTSNTLPSNVGDRSVTLRSKGDMDIGSIIMNKGPSTSSNSNYININSGRYAYYDEVNDNVYYETHYDNGTTQNIKIGSITMGSDSGNNFDAIGKSLNIGSFNTSTVGQHNTVNFTKKINMVDSVYIGGGRHINKSNNAPTVVIDVDAPDVDDRTTVSNSTF